jgi:hypothetical protein
MTLKELEIEVKNNPNGQLAMAYRIGYSQGLKDKSVELAPLIEKLTEIEKNENPRSFKNRCKRGDY